MALVREGEPRALDAIFHRHGGPAFSLAYRMCGRRSMAEDIVQDAFLQLWRSRGRYDHSRGSVRSWVLGIVHNRAIDAFRHQTATASRDIVDDDATARCPPLSGPSPRSSAATTPARSAAR